MVFEWIRQRQFRSRIGTSAWTGSPVKFQVYLLLRKRSGFLEQPTCRFLRRRKQLFPESAEDEKVPQTELKLCENLPVMLMDS